MSKDLAICSVIILLAYSFYFYRGHLSWTSPVSSKTHSELRNYFGVTLGNDSLNYSQVFVSATGKIYRLRVSLSQQQDYLLSLRKFDEGRKMSFLLIR